MSGLIERFVDKGIKYGAVFAEVGSPSLAQQDIDTL